MGYGARCPQAGGCATNESVRDPMDELEATEFLVDKLRGTRNNADFFDSMRRGWRPPAGAPPMPGMSLKLKGPGRS